MPPKTAKSLCPSLTPPSRRRSLRLSSDPTPNRRHTDVDSNEYTNRVRSGKRKRDDLSDTESTGNNFESPDEEKQGGCDQKILQLQMPRCFKDETWPLWKDMLLIDQLFKAQTIQDPYSDLFRENKEQYSWQLPQLWERVADFVSVGVIEHGKTHNLELDNSPVTDSTLDTVQERARLYGERFSEIDCQNSDDRSESEFIWRVGRLFNVQRTPLGPFTDDVDDDDDDNEDEDEDDDRRA